MSTQEETLQNKVSISLLSGFLGSGKTTFINNVLSQDHGLKIAIIENEFGELAIDQDIISSKDGIIEMANGCICCSLQEDLIQTIIDLLEKVKEIDHILIESTGVANPGPIVQSILASPELNKKYQFNSVISFIDSKHFFSNLKHLDKDTPFEDQLAFADHLIINKSDLVNKEEIDLIQKELFKINKTATVHVTSNSEIQLKNLLTFDYFDHKSIQQSMPNTEVTKISFTQIGDLQLKEVNISQNFVKLQEDDSSHHTSIKSVALKFEGSINPVSLEKFLNVILIQYQKDLYRIKGILNFPNNPHKIILQGVFDSLSFSEGDLWKEERKEEKYNHIVFIGKDLIRENLENGFVNCID